MNITSEADSIPLAGTTETPGSTLNNGSKVRGDEQACLSGSSGMRSC